MAVFQALLDIFGDSYQTSPEIRVPWKDTLLIFTIEPLGLLFMGWYHFNIALIVFLGVAITLLVKKSDVVGRYLHSFWEVVCATDSFCCIRVVMSEHYTEGLVVLVVFGVPHGFWYNHVRRVFFSQDWLLADIILSPSWLLLLIRLSPKLFRKVCADDLSQFVGRFLVSSDEASQLANFLCNNKDMRAQTTTIAKGFAALVA